MHINVQCNSVNRMNCISKINHINLYDVSVSRLDLYYNFINEINHADRRVRISVEAKPYK